MTETKYKDIYIDGEDVYKKRKNGELIKLCKWVDNVGYYTVKFLSDGKIYYKRVHRLIAQTLIPNPDELPQVDHIDGNKLNNKLTNLKWITNRNNTQAAYDNGLYKSTKQCPIKAIDKNNQEVLLFKSIRECAKKLGLNRKTITSILKGAKLTNNYNYDFEYIN